NSLSSFVSSAAPQGAKRVASRRSAGRMRAVVPAAQNCHQLPTRSIKGMKLMPESSEFRGILAASLTPLRPDLSIDRAALVRHCRWLLEHGCHGIALFGTTGEGPSFSLAERKDGLETLLAAGVPPSALMVGTGCAALPETVELTAHAVALGCPGVLTLPPFY